MVEKWIAATLLLVLVYVVLRRPDNFALAIGQTSKFATESWSNLVSPEKAGS